MTVARQPGPCPPAVQIARLSLVYLRAAHGSSIKASLGKLTANPHEVLATLEPAGFLSLPVVGEQAARVATLPPVHGDPFDRLLIAQALTEPMRLLTDDAVLGGYRDIVTVV